MFFLLGLGAAFEAPDKDNPFRLVAAGKLGSFSCGMSTKTCLQVEGYPGIKAPPGAFQNVEMPVSRS